jgi:hypothetical protein
MISNDFEPTTPRAGALRRRTRGPDKPNVLAVCLGVVCVVGVFGMLGLLYSFG